MTDAMTMEDVEEAKRLQVTICSGGVQLSYPLAEFQIWKQLVQRAALQLIDDAHSHLMYKQQRDNKMGKDADDGLGEKRRVFVIEYIKKLQRFGTRGAKMSCISRMRKRSCLRGEKESRSTWIERRSPPSYTPTWRVLGPCWTFHPHQSRTCLSATRWK